MSEGVARDGVWLVTGASAGFGRAIVREVAARGGRAIATARDPASLADLASLAPDRVLTLPLDVTDRGEVADAVAAAERRFGRIDVLVNNAGYGFLSGVEEASEAEIRAQFEVNFFGLAAVTRAVLPAMRRQGSGTIVNLSSAAGTFGFPGSAYYCASKFAVEGFSESLAKELAPFGIRVLIVEPGPFRTDFFGRSLAGPAAPMPEYAPLAEMRRQMTAAGPVQPGDPARGAAAIVDAVRGGSPAPRLVLGAGALERIRKAHAARLAEVEACREIAARADFPSG